MLKFTIRISILAGCFLLMSRCVPAQEIVHALTGTVSSTNPIAKTITVYTDNRSEGRFKDMTNPGTRIVFDKKLRAGATPADSFKENGSYAIVYYFGDGNVRTAVALRNLGKGPFTRSIGSVVKFDKGNHSISIKNQSGAIESFNIKPETVIETGTGAMEGSKYQPQGDDHVKVTASVENGGSTALFIVAL